MTREAIADRLVNYSDAIVAFSVVNSLAFLIALTERDVRCSIAPIQLTFWTGFILFPTVLTAGLFVCRYAERRLRDASGDDDPRAARALRYFHFARIGIVWTTALVCIPMVRLALSDTCGATGP
ncbi:MAG: hypothetical protein ACR2P8_07195 [Myxococcota bacterium]